MSDVDWVNDLLGKVEAALSDHKTIKFTNYRNKKNFINKIKHLIQSSIEEHESKKVEIVSSRNKEDIIKQITPNRKQQFSIVMTESDSNKGDDLLQSRGTGVQNAIKPKDANSW
jgi:type III secretory pathway lipoprotein EscJ